LLNRRTLLAASIAALASAGESRAAVVTLTVYKTPTCGCCGAWVDHMRAAGFRPELVELADLTPIRRRYGVPDTLASCHTGVIGGYAIEGHVPASDVRRLLQQRPEALALVVPGMPLGSPGMETPDGARQPFRSFLVRRDGGVTVFAEHA
jgi:hypothetical protein